MQIASYFCGGLRGPSDYLIGFDRKITDWLIKSMLLGGVETALRSGIKAGSDIIHGL